MNTLASIADHQIWFFRNDLRHNGKNTQPKSIAYKIINTFKLRIIEWFKVYDDKKLREISLENTELTLFLNQLANNQTNYTSIFEEQTTKNHNKNTDTLGTS